MSKEEQLKREAFLKRKWDNENMTEFALKQAIGKSEYKKAISIAQKMRKENMPVTRIAKYTGLSIEEIEKL